MAVVGPEEVGSISSLRRRLAEEEPYGSAGRIRNRAHATYQFLAQIGAERIPGRVGEFLGPLSVEGDPAGRVLHDTVLRRRIDQARLTMARSRTVDWDELGRRVEPFVDTFAYDAAGTFPRPGFAPLADTGLEILVDPDFRDPWLNEFHEIFLAGLTPDGTSEHYDIVGMTSAEAETAAAGWGILQEYVPELVESIRPHFSLLAAVDGERPFFSASTKDVPSAVFVSRSCLTDPLRAAEALLHEGVHSKLYDMYVGFSILGAGYDKDTIAHVKPAWHEGRESWPFDRALAAYHVYVHLAVFYSTLAALPDDSGLWRDYTRGQVEESARSCGERARLLGADLLPLGEAHAGGSGVAFLRWLDSVLTDHLEARSAA
ncbi:aKG-HExxH-type peptide beta-hydroxylase [Streptomyces sp. NPDC003943]